MQLELTRKTDRVAAAVDYLFSLVTPGEADYELPSIDSPSSRPARPR